MFLEHPKKQNNNLSERKTRDYNGGCQCFPVWSDDNLFDHDADVQLIGNDVVTSQSYWRSKWKL